MVVRVRQAFNQVADAGTAATGEAYALTLSGKQCHLPLEEHMSSSHRRWVKTGYQAENASVEGNVAKARLRQRRGGQVVHDVLLAVAARERAIHARQLRQVGARMRTQRLTPRHFLRSQGSR